MKAIGDARNAVVISSTGAIVWLCLPDFDSPNVFARMVYEDGGGALELQPALPFTSTQRYLQEPSVLETTFRTSRGVVRLIDSMTVPGRELARRIVGVSGLVPMRWRMRPKFGFAADGTGLELRENAVVGTCSGATLALATWDAGRPRCRPDRAWGHFSVQHDQRALLALTSAPGEMPGVPVRGEVAARLDAAIVRP